MTENEILKNKTLRLLGEIISYESAKPDDEADFDLIEECETMMCDILEGNTVFSDEEIRDRIENVKQKSKQTKSSKKVRRYFSRTAAVLCAVFVLCISVCAICLIHPEIRDGIMKSVGLPTGESVDINGITYINNGIAAEYRDMETLLLENNLDMMYPHRLPENVKIETILLTEQGRDLMAIVFSDHYGNILISLKGNDAYEKIKKDAEKVFVGNKEFHIMELEDQWIALISDDRYTYYISYQDQAGLKTIMESFY